MFWFKAPVVTMWMFMLMMMVFTRTRSEDSRISTNQLVAEGSASARVPIKNRRRKSKDITTTGKYHNV
ncbi:hypothetical protein Hanom_Chr02g00141191 [Helianthus anomalus]